MMNAEKAQSAFNAISLEEHRNAGTMNAYHAEVAHISEEFLVYLTAETGIPEEVSRTLFNAACGRAVGYHNAGAVYLEYARPYMSA